MSVHVTEHAIDRYCERIANVPRDQVRVMILEHGRAIEAASRFGAHTVRLGNGCKLVITGRSEIRVVTVLDRRMINKADRPKDGVVCCGLCGMRAGHPVVRACTRADCCLASRGEPS